MSSVVIKCGIAGGSPQVLQSIPQSISGISSPSPPPGSVPPPLPSSVCVYSILLNISYLTIDLGNLHVYEDVSISISLSKQHCPLSLILTWNSLLSAATICVNPALMVSSLTSLALIYKLPKLLNESSVSYSTLISPSTIVILLIALS